MTEQSLKPASATAQPTADENASAARDAMATQTAPAPGPVPQDGRKATRKRKLLVGGLGVVVLVVLVVFGIP